MSENAFISIGSNVRPEFFFPRAVERLQRIGQVTAVSTAYQSKAVGESIAPDFLNAAALVETDLSPTQVRDLLHEIEAELGRVRSDDKNMARTIDLDLCLYGKRVIQEKTWAIPHREVARQAYVAVPLAELAPDFVHPAIGVSLRDLAERLGPSASLLPRNDVVLIFAGKRESPSDPAMTVHHADIRLRFFLKTICVALLLVPSTSAQSPQRPRARDLGIEIGVLPPGPLNTITDVAGVRVGHCTLIEGSDIRTGVTAIIPHGDNVFQQKVPAAIVVGNGFGKLVGATQVNELGTLETPILLTNTLSTFAVADALVSFSLARPGNENVRSVNPVVAETNDGFLNDIRAMRVAKSQVLSAIAAARSGQVEEGSVGAGTGTRCLGWKGGIGTASRRLPDSLGHYGVGVLTQTNFGGVLTVGGAPVGKELGRYFLREYADEEHAKGGSCVIVVATDAPLDARQLRRLAKRALLGLAAVGSPMTHGSGDYVIAFSTDENMRTAYEAKSATETRTILRDDRLSPLFQAVREATEEAILNSLFRATTVTGYQHRTVEAIPIQRVVDICRRHGVIRKTKSSSTNGEND